MINHMTPQEFIQKYNELSQKSGYVIRPVIKLEVFKVPQASQPEKELQPEQKERVDKEGKKD
ncbi:MAG: hypothetical protein GWP09_02070 [Nitrospiraceae bacterium]|nr:hypothetical protein [Nitrospiraceae bacterium]